jgi:hypothetical protein
MKGNPPPLQSDLERAELKELASTQHPISRYQKLSMAGDLSMERLLSILRNPHLKLPSAIDALAMRHDIPASYVVVKLTKFPYPDRTLLDKWMKKVPNWQHVLHSALIAPHIVESFNEKLCMDLVAHMSYTLATENVWTAYCRHWSVWKKIVNPSEKRLSLKQHEGSTDIMFIPTILLLRAAIGPPSYPEIVRLVLNNVKLPSQSPRTKEIFQRLLQHKGYMTDPPTVVDILFSARRAYRSPYRHTLEFAEYVQLVVAELLKHPERLREDKDAQTKLKTLLTCALEDCGVPVPVRPIEIPQGEGPLNSRVEDKGFVTALDWEQWVATKSM